MVVQHGDEQDIPDQFRINKPGSWMPADHRIHRAFLRRVSTAAAENPQGRGNLTPGLEAFRELIECNSRIYMFFNQMFDEVPKKHPYLSDPTGTPQIRDYEHMLEILNLVITSAPEWTDAAQAVGMVGVPMNAIYDYPMGTPSGHAAFLDPEVNQAIKRVLNEWGEFLMSPKSAYVLGKGKSGWFGETATSDIMAVANAPHKSSMKFEDMFVCDPSAENYGYKSWDDFFTRHVHDKARPVASPHDDSIIANCCESRVYNIETDVKLRDRFWAKGQPYSLTDMFNKDPLAEQFTGGTIYQAFLSALSYHRWHSPVSGTIKRAFLVDGTYFSEPLVENPDDPTIVMIDVGALGTAQGYLSALAARAVIVIEADNKDIGLVGFVGIGMDEVSTCDITVKEGQHVKKGQETGMFHFGGSSHCVIFQKGVKVEGFPEVGRKENVPVRGQLAVVKK